ncbi:MAG: DUF4055 domain-containing protein [Pseudomonadota bacterium]
MKRLSNIEHVREMRRTCRDAANGDLAIRDNALSYVALPAELGNPRERAAYLFRGRHVPVLSGSISTMLGCLFAKAPEIEIGHRFVDQMIDTCGIAGEPMTEIMRETAQEVLEVGTVALFLNQPSVDPNYRTADEKFRPPRIQTFSVEQWAEEPKTEWVNGTLQLTSMKFDDGQHETSDGLRDGTFEVYLNPDDDFRCWVRIAYFEPKLEQEVITSDERYGVGHSDEGIRYIPVVIVGPDGIAPKIAPPPLYPVAKLSIQAWGTSLELGALLWRAGFGQHYVIGPVSETDLPTRSGPGTLWHLPPGCEVGQLQTDPNAAPHLQNEIDKTISAALTMSANFMSVGTAAQATASTSHAVASMKMKGSMSLLQSVANAVEAAMAQCIEWAIQWDARAMQVEPVYTVRLNREWLSDGIEPAMLKLLLELSQTGYLSAQAVYMTLEKSGLTLPHDFDTDQDLLRESTYALDPPSGSPTLDGFT